MKERVLLLSNDPYFDPIARVERRRWRLDFPDGRRKFTPTRREAREWAEEMGYAVDEVEP